MPLISIFWLIRRLSKHSIAKIRIPKRIFIDRPSLYNTKIKDKLKDLTNYAFEKDIFGAPTFVVNNKIFWGQDRLEYALDEYNS